MMIYMNKPPIKNFIFFRFIFLYFSDFGYNTKKSGVRAGGNGDVSDMNDREYIKRLFDGIVKFTLKSKGALVIVGPKWCGKSTTANRYAKTVIDLMWNGKSV